MDSSMRSRFVMVMSKPKGKYSTTVTNLTTVTQTRSGTRSDSMMERHSHSATQPKTQS